LDSILAHTSVELEVLAGVSVPTGEQAVDEMSVDREVPAVSDERNGVIYGRRTLRLRRPMALLEDGWLHLKKALDRV